MHPCPGKCIATGRAVIYYARAAHAFSAGIKCRRCILITDQYTSHAMTFSMHGLYYPILALYDLFINDIKYSPTRLYVTISDEVAEWLRRWTANPLGSARVGSNPILVDVIFD